MSHGSIVLSCAVDGTTYTTNLNTALAAIDSMHSGNHAPTENLTDGKLWLDNNTGVCTGGTAAGSTVRQTVCTVGGGTWVFRQKASGIIRMYIGTVWHGLAKFANSEFYFDRIAATAPTTAGDYLTYDGTKNLWKSQTNLRADALPTQASGTTDQILSSNGTTSAWIDAPGGIDAYVGGGDAYKIDAVVHNDNKIYRATAAIASPPAVFNSTQWTELSPVSGATGVLKQNKTINNSINISATENALSVGPVTVAAGATVTVATGSVWTII